MAYNTKVLYITCHGVMNSVFDSQVLAYVRRLRDAFDVHLLAMDSLFGVRGEIYIKKAEAVRNELGSNCILTTHLPFAGRPSLWWDARRVCKVVREMTNPGDRLIIHGRGQIAGYLAILARRSLPDRIVRTITDVRGPVTEEMAYGRTSFMSKLIANVRIRQFRPVERVAISQADAVFAVSTPLMNYLAERCHLPSPRKVIPTCVDTSVFSPDPKQREALRDSLGIGERFAVVFTGSMATWQISDEIIATFTEIKRIVPDSVLVILTRDIEAAKQAMANRQLMENEYIICSVPYAQVPQYLSACDLALLVRYGSVVNTLSCPVKFAEYLACGLPVAVGTAGDTGAVARKYKVGLILPEDLTREKLLALRDDPSARERALRAAYEVYDLRRGVEEISEVYRTLLSGDREGAERPA